MSIIPTSVLPSELLTKGNIFESGRTASGKNYVCIKETDRYRSWHIAAVVIGTIVTGIIPMLFVLLFSFPRNCIWSWCMWKKEYEVPEELVKNTTISELFGQQIQNSPTQQSFLSLHPSESQPPRTTPNVINLNASSIVMPSPNLIEMHPRTLQEWQKLAEQGSADAQDHLGVCYMDGEEIEKNEKEACKWFHLAAKQGHAAAQNSLGVCYMDGEGVEQNEKEACKWFQLAAEQGHAAAQNNLGNRYFNG